MADLHSYILQNSAIQTSMRIASKKAFERVKERIRNAGYDIKDLDEYETEFREEYEFAYIEGCAQRLQKRVALIRSHGFDDATIADFLGEDINLIRLI